jgi:hypothetical protein
LAPPPPPPPEKNRKAVTPEVLGDERIEWEVPSNILGSVRIGKQIEIKSEALGSLIYSLACFWWKFEEKKTVSRKNDFVASRFEFWNLRLEVRDLRFTIGGSRLEVRDSRFEIRGSRFKIRD